MSFNKLSLINILVITSCFQSPLEETTITISNTKTLQEEKDTLQYRDDFIAYSFDFPVGKPNAANYYNAQKFQENAHLGDDWNAITGGNTDLGDPVFSIANGYVRYAKDYGEGWGNVIKIIHKLPNNKFVESLYAHCDTIVVNEKVWVKKGEQIGTIGTANGVYLAHLHFEIRDSLELPIGPGYSNETAGYLDPTKFIEKNR